MSAIERVPTGFKNTDVGIIPEDWTVSTLTEECGFGGGTTPPRSQHDRYFVGGSNNWIKTTDLNNSLIGLSEELITDVAISETGLKKHPIGTVLVAMYGGFNQIGRTGLITKPSAINQALVAVKPKPKKLNSYYLLSELNYNVDYWRGVASSSRKDPNITSNDVKNYKIALPSVEEQTSIANALSDVDELLTELEKLKSKKQAIKTATMQQLLTGKTRLPQFATYTEGEKLGQPKGTKPSELGEIPEDWDVKSVGEFTDCSAGGTPSTQVPAYWGGDHPWMSSGELHLKRVYDVAERITDLGLANSSTKYIPKNSVLMGLAGQGKTRGTVAISKIKLCTNQSIAAIFPSKMHSTDYLFYNLDNRYEELRSLSTGDGGRGGLNLSIIRKLKLPFPDFEEQTAIATILSDMDNEIQTLEQRLAKIRQIKKGMMQELLTGRTRLPFKKES
ncbi:restriction endonuclease subunit S [Vibrio bathopelagicus]